MAAACHGASPKTKFAEQAGLDESILDCLACKPESILHFSDLSGRENLLVVFPDDTVNLLDDAAILCDAIPKHIVPLVLRHGDLFQLAIPFAGPRAHPGASRHFMRRGSFHTAGYAKYRGSVLHGRDVRSDIILPQRPASSLQHHLEISRDVVRGSILNGLTFRRSLIGDLDTVLSELMLSTLLVATRPSWTIEEIVSEFRQVVRGRLHEIVDEWNGLKAHITEQGDCYSEDHEFRAVWLYEQFLANLRGYAQTSCESKPAEFQEAGSGWGSAAKTGKNWIEEADLSCFRLRGDSNNAYHNAVAVGIEELSSVREEIVSLVLYGSLARGVAQPGVSDILDAFLVLKDECFRDESAFRLVLGAMVRSCRRMAECSTVPFHPYRYTSATDWACHHPVNYLAEWQSNALSHIILGEDIRPHAGSSADGVIFGRRMLFSLPQLMLRCSRYLHHQELSTSDLSVVLNVLEIGTKLLPRAISAACNYWVDNESARRQLAGLLPALDLSVVDKISALRATAPNQLAVEAKSLLRCLLECVENACEAAKKWLISKGQLEELLAI